MKTYRAFYDKDYNFLKLLESEDEEIPKYSLNHAVVFWEDFEAHSESEAKRKAHMLGTKTKAALS